VYDLTTAFDTGQPVRTCPLPATPPVWQDDERLLLVTASGTVRCAIGGGAPQPVPGGPVGPGRDDSALVPDESVSSPMRAPSNGPAVRS
jgi:hypothetical protein